MPNFNAFMHRRNIFRKEPDFKKLACDYHELKPFMTAGSKNKLKFDFKNPEALRALTCALLHRYFQKRIILPSDRMIPAVPQRLNYICWIEDLVELYGSINTEMNVLGVDIGTGASCIFPILSCHRNPTWTFIGVEADQKSFDIASENVRKNFMEDRIRIMKVSTDETLNDILSLATNPVTFIMCNPPFFEEEYGVTLELNPNINIGGRAKSSSNTSDKVESIVSGGEIAFVGRLLEHSRHLKEDVVIYTSMLGKKQSLTHFKQTFSSLNEDNLSWTWAELCQGKTIRYAIAWTFKPGLDLTRAPLLRHGKNKSWKFKLLRKMPKRDGHLELLEDSELLKNLVSRELMIAKARVTKQTPQSFEMLIKANDRTWANQRRKRREQQLNNTNSINNSNTINNNNISGTNNKHKHQATLSAVSFNSSSSLSATSIGQDNNNSIGSNNQRVASCSELTSDLDLANRMIICDSDSNSARDAITHNNILSQGGTLVTKSTTKTPATTSTSTSNLLTAAADAVGKTSGSIYATNSGDSSTDQLKQGQQQACVEMMTTEADDVHLNGNHHHLNNHQIDTKYYATTSTSNIPTSASSTTLASAASGASLLLAAGLSKKRKNPSSCSSSPSRVCPSPNDEMTDDDNQSTDQTDHDEQNEDSMNESIVEIKRICIKDTDESENMDDIYDYLLCCRISLTRVCHDLYFELKLEHPCTAATDAYDLFQYFRNKLSDK